MRAFVAAFISFIVAGTSARAAEALRLDGAFTQGAMVLGWVAPGSRVALDGRPVRVTPEGRFVIGFGREAAAEAVLAVIYADGRREARRLAVAPRQYEIQRIDGLPPRQVTPSAKDLARIRREAALIAEVRARDSERFGFLGPFRWPVAGIVSGVYGSQRILNGEPRRPHYGIDIAAPEGTPVLAPAAGVVALAEPDLFFTGGTVMLDHGYGVTSVFSHLARVDVAVGAEVRAGDALGTVGATGRATGPHLDFRVNWFEVRLDPALLLGPAPE